MSPTSLALVASAFGGAVGALVLRFLLRLGGKLLVERKPLATYDCAEDAQGAVGFKHQAGKRKLDDPLATNKRSWEHTPQDQGTGDPFTVYGPYVNDFGRPGYYRVRFRIYGANFERTEEPVVIIDVVQGPFLDKGEQFVMLSHRIIRGKELSDEYQDFDVHCYAAGSGTYQYRCLVRAKAFDPSQHILRFDTVTVFIYKPTWEFL